MADSFAERQSRLVSLVYQVLGTIEPPALESSEGEVLEALASAFHRKAQTTVEAERTRRKESPRCQSTSCFRRAADSVPLIYPFTFPEVPLVH
jgi:hypothetical protein